MFFLVLRLSITISVSLRFFNNSSCFCPLKSPPAEGSTGSRFDGTRLQINTIIIPFFFSLFLLSSAPPTQVCPCRHAYKLPASIFTPQLERSARVLWQSCRFPFKQDFICISDGHPVNFRLPVGPQSESYTMQRTMARLNVWRRPGSHPVMR